MREIGGYLEIEHYNNFMLHEDAIALNTGRNCLAYLIEANNIKSIYLPYFICNAVIDICNTLNVKIYFYHINNINESLNFSVENDSYLYIVNYYGQLSNKKIIELKSKYNNLIIDNTHAYFQKAVENVHTIYTCRKFFGVPDGAFLYTNKKLHRNIEQDISFGRIQFLVGRYEKNASEFYKNFIDNEEMLGRESLKIMSKLTNNLLHAIDYNFVEERRTRNYNFLFDRLNKKNKLNVKRVKGAFAYPLYLDNGLEIRKKLIKNKIYIPILWPNVIENKFKNFVEYDMAMNILPLPCDQRYDEHDMEYIIKKL